MKSFMPEQKKGRSHQGYGTPTDLFDAVEQRFGAVSWDLAASEHNHKAADYLTEDNDALSINWHQLGGLLWLNPPFGNVAPWAKKCLEESEKGARVLMLCPASVSSNWFRQYVHDQSCVLFLNPRPTFTGETKQYPQSCMIIAFGFGRKGFHVWQWKQWSLESVFLED